MGQIINPGMASGGGFDENGTYPNMRPSVTQRTLCRQTAPQMRGTLRRLILPRMRRTLQTPRVPTMRPAQAARARQRMTGRGGILRPHMQRKMKCGGCVYIHAVSAGRRQRQCFSFFHTQTFNLTKTILYKDYGKKNIGR